MQVTIFTCATDVRTDATCPLHDALAVSIPAASKRDVPLWSPAVFDGPRLKANVREISAWVADLDKATQEQIDETLERLTLAGLEWVAHETYTSGTQPKWRVVVPYASPLPAGEHPRVWAALAERFAPWLDRSASDAGRIFYLPSGPMGVVREVLHCPGEALDWRGLDTEPEPARQQVNPIEVARTIGEVPLGSRHQFALALGGVCQRQGLSRTAALGVALALDFDDPLGRARDVTDSFDALDRDPQAKVLGWPAVRRILGSERSAALSELLGGPPEPEPEPDAERPILLQRNSTFWLRDPFGDTYGPAFSDRELLTRLRHALSNFGLKGAEHRSRADLEAQLAMPLTPGDAGLEYSYLAKANTYDAAKRKLTLACLSWQTGAAERVEWVDTWLRALLGDDYDLGAQWLASLTALDRPAPMLMLVGDRGCGKSLLAAGCGALWGETARAEEALDSFNAALMRTPLVHADEGLPEAMTVTRLREFLFERTRTVNEKYMPRVNVTGCIRMLATSNNDRLFRFSRKGTLTPADVDAIADRLLFIDSRGARSDAARAALESMGANPLMDIARHIRWLAATVPLWNGRTAARPNGQAMAQEMSRDAVAPGLRLLQEAIDRGESVCDGDGEHAWMPSGVGDRYGDRSSQRDLDAAFDLLGAGPSARVRAGCGARRRMRRVALAALRGVGVDPEVGQGGTGLGQTPCPSKPASKRL